MYIIQAADGVCQKIFDAIIKFPLRNIERGKSILTERVVFFKRSVYFSVWVNLQMIFCGAVKFSASWSSPEVLVNPAASTSISPLPWVTRLAPGTRRLWGPRLPRSQGVLQTRIQEAQ